MTPMFGNIQVGIANFVAYGFSFINEALAHLINFGTGRLVWFESGDPVGATAGQIKLGGNLPDLTPKGEDIVAALMTIIHNGIVFVAQIATLLPSNNLLN